MLLILVMKSSCERKMSPNDIFGSKLFVRIRFSIRTSLPFKRRNRRRKSFSIRNHINADAPGSADEPRSLHHGNHFTANELKTIQIPAQT